MEFLNQMKVISERADHSFEREEKLNADIKKLQEEIKNWKSRYARRRPQSDQSVALPLDCRYPAQARYSERKATLSIHGA